MGCLKVNIVPVSGGISASLVGIGDIRATIERLKTKCRCIRAKLMEMFGMDVSAFAVNDLSSFAVECVTSRPKVSLSLVCMSNLDTECYLQVLDGNIITLDGCFVKVLKG